MRTSSIEMLEQDVGGIPNESHCSICEFVRTAPPKDALKVLSEATSAWCALHRRRLLLHPYASPDPNPEPTISSTVCSRFMSIYVMADGRNRWPLAPAADEEHLWESRPSTAKPYWTHRPYVRLDSLPRVDPETGDSRE